MKLEEIFSEIRNCRKCELWKYAKQAVVGEGPENSKVMVIGEAPGAEEDKTGRPFVGRAGKLLRNALSSNSLNEVYITNVVKHRPPNNRKPKKEEIKACSEFLLTEIQTVKPKIIIALGSTACNFLTGEKKIKIAIEKNYELMGAKVLVDYHPAAVLRNPKLYKTFEKKIKEAKANL
ncbi:MAG: uracil-DNA glycosylase [Nitrososphaeria archaeon]|nr:uracil-DNA glycosylase [Conexivisphaerales archaeon]